MVATTVPPTAAQTQRAANGSKASAMPAQPLALAVVVDGHELPERLPARVNGTHVLLPLGALAQQLTLAISVKADKRRASGFTLSDEQAFELDLASATVRIGGRERGFDPRHVQEADGDIYVSTQLLSHWLPVVLEADLTARRLRVAPRRTLPLQEQLARQRDAATERAARTTAAAPKKVEAESELTVLELKLDDRVLSDSLTGYVDGRQILLPLGELARLLTLAITVNAERGSAEGYVLREERGFALNVEASVAKVGGREQVFESRLARVIGDDIYVASRLLSHWLPLDFDINMSTLQVRAMPRQKLPLQERIARETAAARLATTRSAPQDPGYPRVTSPHGLAGVPFIDQTLEADVRGAPGKRDGKLNYTAYVTADLLGMEASAYVTSSQERPTPDVRVTMARTDPDAGLLGPLGARSVSVGHLELAGVPHLLNARTRGSGLAISNRGLNQPTSFDRQNLRGDLAPGWEVTLYYNDALVSYQSARSDGRYAFDNLPLAMGLNEFRLVFNGPLGQVRVETQRFLLDAAQLKPGELHYAVSLHKSGSSGVRRLAQADLGITPTVSASVAAVQSQQASSKGLSYTQLSLRAYASSMIFSSQYTLAQAGGGLAQFGIKTRLGRFALDVERLQRSGDFVSEIYNQHPSTLRLRDRVSLAGTLVTSRLPAIAVAIDATHERSASGARQFGLSHRLSSTIDGTALAHSLRWTRSDGHQTLLGSMQASRRMLDIGLNAQVEYALLARPALHSIGLGADRMLEGGWRVHAGLQHLGASGATALNAGLAKNLGSYGLALVGSATSQREFSLSLQVFVALGRNPQSGNWNVEAQPMASTGAVLAQAFLDRNGNGVRDAGEPAVPNAAFILNSGGRHPVRTDAQGQVLINRLAVSQYTDIALDGNTLDDPMWQPGIPGVRVLPRPGVVEVIPFAVIEANEVDGTVYLLDKLKRRPVGDVRIELVDGAGKVVSTASSAADGFYLLPRVRPGTYTLRIAPEQVARLRLRGALSRPLVVANDGEFVATQDFVFERLAR
jgi:hypothetical protein